MSLTEQKIEPIVSVIVPVYNVEKYLEKTIKSICAQTIKEIQIILVDDASTDASEKCCEMLAGEDCRIEVYRHYENQGVSVARNTGLLHAKGKYILFVDGDDYIDKDMLETLIGLMGEPETDLAVCGYYINDTPQIGKIKQSIKMTSLECAKAIAGYQRSLVKGYVFNKLFKKELIDSYQLKFDEYIHICEDSAFCYRYVKQCRMINYNPIPKYHYLMRQGSAMHGIVTEKRMSVLETYPIIMEIGRGYREQELNQVLETNYFNHHISILKDVIRHPSKRQREYGDRVFPCIKDNTLFLLTSRHITIRRKILIIGLRIGYPFWRMLVESKSIH